MILFFWFEALDSFVEGKDYRQTRELFEKLYPEGTKLNDKELYEIEANLVGYFNLLDELDRKYFPDESAQGTESPL